MAQNSLILKKLALTLMLLAASACLQCPAWAAEHTITKEEWAGYMRDNSFSQSEQALNAAYKARADSLDDASRQTLKKEQQAWAAKREKTAFEQAGRVKGSPQYLNAMKKMAQDRTNELQNRQGGTAGSSSASAPSTDPGAQAAIFDIKKMTIKDLPRVFNSDDGRAAFSWMTAYLSDNGLVYTDYLKYLEDQFTKNLTTDIFTLINSPSNLGNYRGDKGVIDLRGITCEISDPVHSPLFHGYFSKKYGNTVIDMDDIKAIWRLTQQACQQGDQKNTNIYSIYEKNYLAAHPQENLQKNAAPAPDPDQAAKKDELAPAAKNAFRVDIKKTTGKALLDSDTESSGTNVFSWMTGYLMDDGGFSREVAKFVPNLILGAPTTDIFTLLNSPSTVDAVQKKRGENNITLSDITCEDTADDPVLSSIFNGHFSKKYGNTIIDSKEISDIWQFTQRACRHEDQKNTKIYSIYEKAYLAYHPQANLQKNAAPAPASAENTAIFDIKTVTGGEVVALSKFYQSYILMWLTGYTSSQFAVSNDHAVTLALLLSNVPSESLFTIAGYMRTANVKTTSPILPIPRSCAPLLKDKKESDIFCYVMDGYFSKKHQNTIIDINAINSRAELVWQTCKDGNTGDRQVPEIYETAFLAAKNPQEAKAAPDTSQPKNDATPDKGKEANPAMPQESDISARALCSAFEENEVAANKRYMDKKIVVSGTISEISTDFTGDPEITLGFGDFEISGVVCEMANDDGVENLRKGQSMKLKGKVAGYALGFVQMEDCEIMK